MGSGKSTVGRQLASILHFRFVDMDHELETRHGMEVNQIFSQFGEPYFRELEHNLLSEISQQTDTVISTGGGTPCFYDNMNIMLQSGATVYLKANPSLLYNRLSFSKGKRPLIAGKTECELMDYINQSLAKREPFYSKAAYTINALNIQAPDIFPPWD